MKSFFVLLGLLLVAPAAASWKGHVFTRADIGAGQLRTLQKEARASKRNADEVINEFLKKQTERYRIVASDPVTGPIVAEELDAVTLNKISDRARAVARSLYDLPLAARREVLGAFNADGSLEYPWPVSK